MKIRIILSILLAAPLAVLALAIGDVGGLGNIARYAVSPGFIFGLQAPSSGSWIGDISNALRIAIAVNELYYAILIFAVLSWVGHGKGALRTSA
jgi:hypothetical protein